MPDDDEYEVPLLDQRYFGAGIKRKRIHFVPATTATEGIPSGPSTSAADRYLSIVLKKQTSGPAQSKRKDTTSSSTDAIPSTRIGDDLTVEATDNADAPEDGAESIDELCETCGRPRSSRDSPTASHEASVAHQISLAHSHPPSHVDRRRLGLAVLEAHGWDPDSRKGLGAGGEGVLHPLKARERLERAGLGARAEDVKRLERERPVRLDAGKVRMREQESRRRAAELREAFYRSEDVERYLGASATSDTGMDLEARPRGKRRTQT